MEAQDNLQSFYNNLKGSGVIKGLPDDYNIFKSALSDPVNAKSFYENLKGSGAIKGLPDSFESFSTILPANNYVTNTTVTNNPVSLENLQKGLTDFDEQNKEFFEEWNSYQKNLEEAKKGHDPLRVNEVLNYVRKNAEKYNDLSKEREKLVEGIYTHPDVLEKRKTESERIDRSMKDVDSFIESIDNPNALRFVSGVNPVYLSDSEREQAREVRRLDEAKKIYKDTKEMLQAPSKYDKSNGFLNFLKGSGDTFNNRDFWSAGMTQIARNLDIRDILEKVNENRNGKDIENFLTKGEQALLDAFLTQTRIQSERANDLSGGYMAGQSAAQSVDFMAEFLATGGLAAAASGGAKKAVMKWIIKHTPSSSLRRETAKGLAWATESGLGTLARTPVMPSTYRGVTDELLQYKTDDEGNVLLDENKQPVLKSGWESFRDGFTNSLIENISELSSGHIAGTLGVLGKATNKVLPRNIQSMFKKTGDAIASWKPVELYNNFSKTPVYKFLKETGFNGFVPEMAEEWYGNGLRAVLGDTAALKDFATVENQLITAAAFLPMSLIGGSVSTVQMVKTKGKYENSLKTLQGVLSDLGYQQDQVDYFIDQVNASSAREMVKTITPLINRIASENEEKGKEVFKAVSDFVYAKNNYHMLNGAYAEQMGERKKAEDKRLIEETGGYVNSATGKVQIVTDKEGNSAFLVGESLDVDHKVYILNYDGEKITLSREDFEEEYKLEKEFDKDEFLSILIMNKDVENESTNLEDTEETEQTNIKSENREQDQIPQTGLGQMSYKGENVNIIENKIQDDGTILVENEEGEAMRVPAKDLEGIIEPDVPETTLQESPQSEENVQTEPTKEIPLTKAGKPDYNTMLETDPEMFASEWEKRSNPEKAKATLERQSENIGKRIEALQAKVDKETDLNKIADIEDEIADFLHRKEIVDGVIKNRYSPLVIENEQVEEVTPALQDNIADMQALNVSGAQEEIKPIGRGFFGNIYDQFRGKAKEAVNFLLQRKEGEAIGALHHSEVGDIDLVWGEEGSGKSNGFGLAKLSKYHPEVLDNLQDILEDMEVVKRTDNRVNLESNTHRAAVRLEWDGKRKNWLLTAFEKEAPTSIDKTTDTGENQNDLQSDTALLQNVGPSSENKDNESVIEKQQDKAENTENTPVNVPRARVRHLDGKEYTGDIVKEDKGRVTIKDDISGREISVPKKRVIERFEQSNTNDHLTQQDERSNVDPLLSTPLRKLKKGEFAYVERVFTENKLFSFTGAEKIESAEDVAYIFKELENASVENVFMVLIKDGIPTVQHLGIGGYCSAIVNTPAVWESYKRLNPDKVYFVHNHPAGNLEASRMDQNTLKNLRSIFGDKLQPGIIINLKSGKYGQFSESDSWSEEKSKKQINEVPIKIYSFNKQVFDADFDPESLFQIKTSDDVASFISSHRLGDRKKISFLVLNNKNQVVGNFFTGYTKLTDKNIGNLSDYIVRHINKYGGQNAILYGDFSLDPFINRKLDRVIKEKSGNGFNLLDVIKCSGNNSAISVMETPAVYENAKKESAKEKEEISNDVRFRNTPEIINDRFNKELQQQIEGTLLKGHVYQLGNPNNILRCAGIPDLSIELAASRLSLKASKTYESNHPFELSAVMNLPVAIQNPIAVFDSKTRPGSKVIMTELTDSKGNYFVIAMQTNIPKNRYGTRTIQINDIRSVYPKDNIRDIVNWINRGDLLKWADKTKLGNWLAQQRSNSAEVATPVSEFDIASKIVENYENPTLLEGEISSKVDRMSGELGVKVNKVKDRGDLPEGIQERMKDGRYPGLFDPKTGKVWIIADEVTDVADAEATILHEVVGHKGIHGLFGDKLPEFCKKVLDSLKADERSRLLKEYNGNEQLAAEEYVARFAEGYENPTMWEKVKALVKEFFREMGIDLKLSDNDLKYILWKAKNRLKEGEGMLETIEKTARNREIERKLWGKDIKDDSIEEINELFNKELDDLTEENADRVILSCGKPGMALLSAGLPNRRIALYGNKLIKKAKSHRYSVSDVKDLPKYIQNPIAVFKGSYGGGFAVLTEMFINGKNTLVSIDINKGEIQDLNLITSVFDKNSKGVINWINERKMLFVDKEKALNYLSSSALIADATNNSELSSATNIIKNFENPKLEDRILFRKAPDKDFSRRHLNFAERARAELQDRMLSVKMLLDEVKRRGGKVTDYANPYIAENLATSKSKAQIEAFDKNIWDPLMEVVKSFSERGKSFDDIDMYMMAKHAPERNARIQEINNKENGSGISNEEAKQIVDEFEKDFTKDEIDNFWNKVCTITRFTTETQRKHGLIDKATKDYYDNMYEYYVPLRGWKESEAKEIEYLSDSRTTGVINLNKKAEGRSSIADNPLSYIANMAHSAIVVGNKNDIKRNVFEMMVLNKNPDLYQLKKIYRVNTGTEAEPIWVEQMEKPAAELWLAGRVEVVTNHRNDAGRTRFQTKEHQVEVFVNGQKYIMEFNGNMGTQVANAINGMNLRRADGLQNTVGRVTRWMSANYTSRNPAFVVTNFTRDFGYAVPAYWMKGGNATTLMKNMPKAFAAIHNDLSGKKVDSEVQQLYNEFKENGGLTGYVHMNDVESYKNQIKREIRRSVGKKTLGDLAFRNVAMRWGGAALEYLAQMSENSTRFAVYMSERQAGKSATQAAYAAKEITTNFNRKGRSSGVIGSLFAFFNATIQGSANAVDLARKSPGKFSVYCAGIIMIQYLASALCRMFGGDDEIGEKNYDRLSDWVKYNNLVLPDVFGMGDGKFITIPLPHFFRALSSLGVIAGEVTNGVKTVGQGIESLFDAVAGDLTPVEIATPQFKNLNSLFQSVMPTAVKPYMEAYIFNRNFMGLPVSRKSYFGSQEGIVPQYKLATNKTNPLLVDLAKWLNKISGGGDYTTSEISFDAETGDVGRNGWRSWGDLNPAKFEHLVEGIFGGRLTFFNNIWKTAKSVISEEEVETVNIPVLRRLYQSPYSSSAWEKFYEVRDQVANIDAKANEFMKLGDYDNFIKVNSYKNASLVNVYKSYEKMIRRLNKAINLTKEGSLTDMLKKQREDLVKDFALKMKEMEKKTSKKNVLVE